MVGALSSADGTPLSAVQMTTVEARAITTEQGDFAIEYQQPATYIDFRVGSTLYQRHYRQADDGQQVKLQLPKTRNSELVCTATEPCMALLTWNLPDGLIGRVTARCESGKKVPLEQIPTSEPLVNCQQNITEPPSPIHFADKGTSLEIGEPIYSYSVTLKTTDGKTARPCALTADGKDLDRDPNGLFIGTGWGLVTLQATCAGVQLLPEEYKIKRDGAVDIIWDTP
jgi:hypothetical protein